eukprot:CAMPEP_0180251940 /NCGR_PEP_ID=MMETSP0987-20121128/38724_1 /TAXON_ID=697907 /ORGANISM="non described non described, Strain CCMP2293" /LENGTH=124 /DNA_ID=CAMNT_0022220553 /DNA_START=457 /DNA_END=829 /DNA_ORIENTATION=+
MPAGKVVVLEAREVDHRLYHRVPVELPRLVGVGSDAPGRDDVLLEQRFVHLLEMAVELLEDVFLALRAVAFFDFFEAPEALPLLLLEYLLPAVEAHGHPVVGAQVQQPDQQFERRGANRDQHEC